MTVTSGRSNLRGALHSTFLRDSYYWDGTIVRAKPAILRASVGSTDASASLLARVGVVGPKRARRLLGR